MPKKKGKKGGGGGGGGGDKGKVDPTHQALVLPPDREKWVTLDVKLVNWSFMDFKVRIRTDTPLFFLHKKLKERHGRMNELQLYRKSVNEDNLMTDEFKTFEAYGIPGGPKNSAPVEYIIYYEFKPYHSDEPVILAEKIIATDDPPPNSSLKLGSLEILRNSTGAGPPES